MAERTFHDGQDDGLKPLQSLRLDEVDSFSELLRRMQQTAFGGRQLGEAFDILLQTAQDSQCRTVLTVSGAMTVAKQGSILCDLIEHKLVDAIVATGALVAHGLTETIGGTHYQYDPSHDDERLFRQGYNRIYDTLEMEANLNDVEQLVRHVLNHYEPEQGVWSSARLCRAIGEELSRAGEHRGILRSAWEHETPVFIPAFTDSEMGLDVATWAMSRSLQQLDPQELSADEVFRESPAFNPFIDLLEYARLIGSNEHWGILTIGGGVPRNWAQQVAPLYDITNERVGTSLPAPRFCCGVRICPEPVHWGGLSGCTYSEGVSWGKFVPPGEGGRYAEVHADATLVLPLLVKGLLEKVNEQV